jgi:hypothetical protein
MTGTFGCLGHCCWRALLPRLLHLRALLLQLPASHALLQPRAQDLGLLLSHQSLMQSLHHHLLLAASTLPSVLLLQQHQQCKSTGHLHPQASPCLHCCHTLR